MVRQPILQVCVVILAVGCLLLIPPAQADVVITEDFATASSSASTTFGGTTNDSHPVFGAGSLSTASSATNSDFAGDTAHNQNAVNFTVTPTGQGNANLSGTLSNSGSAAMGFGPAASSTGTVTLTANFTLSSESFVNFSATGSSSTSSAFRDFGSADATSVFSFPGVELSFSGSHSDRLGTLSTGPFNTSGQVILDPGTYTFSGAFNEVFGRASAGVFPATDAASLTFEIDIFTVPEPGTMALLGAGILGLAGYGWWRRKVTGA
jgi:hypothetical protein